MKREVCSWLFSLCFAFWLFLLPPVRSVQSCSDGGNRVDQEGRSPAAAAEEERKDDEQPPAAESNDDNDRAAAVGLIPPILPQSIPLPTFAAHVLFSIYG
jgi:hypothetical protein